MNSSLNLAEAAHYVFSSTLLKREVTGLVECCFVLAVPCVSSLWKFDLSLSFFRKIIDFFVCYLFLQNAQQEIKN